MKMTLAIDDDIAMNATHLLQVFVNQQLESRN